MVGWPFFKCFSSLGSRSLVKTTSQVVHFASSCQMRQGVSHMVYTYLNTSQGVLTHHVDWFTQTSRSLRKCWPVAKSDRRVILYHNLLYMMQTYVLFLGYAQKSREHISPLDWFHLQQALLRKKSNIPFGFLGTLISQDFKLDGSVASQISWPLPVSSHDILKGAANISESRVACSCQLDVHHFAVFRTVHTSG